MSEDRLPEKFNDLERFVGKWALATEPERNRTRLESSMGDLQEFYDAIVPRAPEALSYLDGFDVNGLPDRERNLQNLLLSMMEVAPAIEKFFQPDVPDGFEWRRIKITAWR